MTTTRLPAKCLATCLSLSLFASSPALATPQQQLKSDTESAEAALERASHPAPSKTIALLLQRAVSRGLISGGVAVIGTSDGIVSVSARGKVTTRPPTLIDERTIFDLASLTKVVATAPAVMKLVESGKIRLSDPLERWFPEFKGKSLGRITVLELLTHTSGLADERLRKGQAMRTMIRKAAAENTRTRKRFRYADINFILLGELVHRASGKPLDVFCREEIFRPLGMKETMFRPPDELDGIIAPTGGVGRGVVQDLTARRLGSVAGHAGLFSSALDLSRYARAVLGGGVLDGRRVFSASTVAEMTAPHCCRPRGVRRGLGWDISSRYSAPRGKLLSKASFGHTGYSGSSIWIDPQSDLFVILLTKRSDYSNVHSFNSLREDVSTVAAAQFGSIDESRQAAAERELARVVTKASLSPHKRNPTLRYAKAYRNGKGKHGIAQVKRAKYVTKSRKARKGQRRA